MLNLIYMHLRPTGQAVGCKGMCPAEDCPRCHFHEQLEAPITDADRRERERIRQRADAVLAGEIPT